MADYLAVAGLQVPEGLDLTQIPPRTAAERVNESEGELNLFDGIDCPICKNKGYIAEGADLFAFTVKDCVCKAKRRARAMAQESGLTDLFARCTFENFTTPDEWTMKLGEAAQDYLRRRADGKWFFVSGRPGTGKTHVCVAICSRLIKAGQQTRFMAWREDAPALKAAINEEDYAARFREFADVDVLYIDDFFKGKVTEADINLAFSLINARYNSRSKRTIISSELPLREIAKLDEAISSRIYERAKGFILHAPDSAKNWREENNA